MEIALPDRLRDESVVLRPLRPDDAGRYAAAFVEDPDLGRLIGIESDPDEASVRERIERLSARTREADFFQLAVADPVNEAFLAAVIVHSLDEDQRRGEVGVWLTPSARRRGVARAAAALVISWLFDELDLLRIEMTTTPENRALCALAARLGFTREGLLRARNIERGQRVDVVWFGMLREEWTGVLPP